MYITRNRKYLQIKKELKHNYNKFKFFNGYKLKTFLKTT